MPMNTMLLVVSLCALAAVGLAYYAVQRWQDPFQIGYLAIIFSWYLGIAFALYFVVQGARLGAFVAGIVGWVTLAFWLIEGRALFLSTTQPTTVLMAIGIWPNVIGLITVGVEIAASHNVFHKLRTVMK